MLEVAHVPRPIGLLNGATLVREEIDESPETFEVGVETRGNLDGVVSFELSGIEIRASRGRYELLEHRCNEGLRPMQFLRSNPFAGKVGQEGTNLLNDPLHLRIGRCGVRPRRRAVGVS